MREWHYGEWEGDVVLPIEADEEAFFDFLEEYEQILFIQECQPRGAQDAP